MTSPFGAGAIVAAIAGCVASTTAAAVGTAVASIAAGSSVAEPPQARTKTRESNRATSPILKELPRRQWIMS